MSRRIGLKPAVFFGGSLLMLLPALVAGSIYTSSLQRRAEHLLAEKLASRGELGANQLGRRLHQLWQEVETLSQSVDIGQADDLRAQLNLISSLGRRYSWLGVANVEGQVVAAVRGLLEGESVAQRPWFRRGLSGPTAIDVHEAQLLSKLLPASPEPYRFIDFSAPVKSSGEASVGVIGVHVDWRWIKDMLASISAPGVEIILLSRDRRVLYGPDDLQDKVLTVGSATRTNTTEVSVRDERWPDGNDYMTVVVPTIGHADSPTFGWSLLVRERMDQALAPTRQLVRSFWLTLGSGAIIALVLLYLGAHWITTPLRRLVGSAERMAADGEPTAPYAETRYQEAERMSRALVRIQSRLMSAKKNEAL